MIRAVLAVSMVVGFPSYAEDLESLFEAKGDTQATRGGMELADSLKSVLSATTPEQNFFLRHLEQRQWQDALLMWDGAFGNSPFETSANGRALRALLQFKAGLPVTGMESMFAISEPKQIQFQILGAWRDSAPTAHPAWEVAQIEWSKSWTELFGIAVATRVRSSQMMGNQKIEDLVTLSAQAPLNSRERAMVDWQLSLAYALNDQADKAAKVMSALLKSKNNPISIDLMNMTAARMLFQNGYFDAALRYYDKIPKSSDFFLEGQEEKAWTYLRRQEPQNALAMTQSLVKSVFRGQVSAETWFVRALSQLKVCDYAGAVDTIQAFPKEFKDYAVDLEALATGKGKAEGMTAVLNKMKVGTVTPAEASKLGGSLPRNTVRDEKLKYLLGAQVLLEKEAQSSEALYAKSLKLSGLQGHLDNLRNKVNMRVSSAKAASIARVRELAKREVEEIRKIVSKMHIVEAELIQRMEVTPRLAKHLAETPDVKVGSTGSLARDTLTFPLEKEFWFDELTNYKVDIKKGCQHGVVR